MKTSYLFFIPILSLLNIAVAQAQNLIGKIVNESNEPVEFANVLLFALPDSAFQTGSVSGADGRFQLSSELSNGLLKVSCIGYTTLYKTYAVGDELLLQLTPDTQILDEIVVKGVQVFLPQTVHHDTHHQLGAFGYGGENMEEKEKRHYPQPPKGGYYPQPPEGGFDP